MEYGACIETRIDCAVLRGASSQDAFAVRITQQAGGDEQRQEVWDQAKRVLDVSYGTRMDETIDPLRDFLFAMGGPAQPFTARDHTDFGPGEGKALWYDLSDLTDAKREEYTADGCVHLPLFKGYEAGAARRYRRITKPNARGFRVWLNNKEITQGLTVDFGTGVVSFDYLPTSGRLYFSGTYDICVRFDGDLTFSAMTPDLSDLSGVTLVECLGEGDFTPASEADAYCAALGRDSNELSALIADFEQLVSV